MGGAPARLVHLYLSAGTRATRKPRSFMRYQGQSSPRFADRQHAAG